VKGVLISFLAALSLPFSANAESYDLGVARIQYPKIEKLMENSKKFAEVGDWEAACSKRRLANDLMELNFEGLQEMKPDMDWFAYRKINLEIEDLVCSVR